MANVLRIGVENPDELLNAGAYAAGALIQIQSAATEAGAFADISGGGSTPTIPLVAGIFAYTGYDPAGASTTWYRTRYKNAGGTLTSDWTPAFQVGSISYCSLYDVRQDLEKAVTDLTADELLLDYIAAATDYIRGYCGVDFIDTGLTYTFDGYDAIYGGRCLLVPRGVRSLSLVETAAITGAAFTTVASTDYFLRPTTQERTPGWPATQLWLSDLAGITRFPRGLANVRLTGTFGFATIPPRIESVARRIVVRAYASRQAGQADLLGTGSEAGTPMVSSYLSKRDRETLDSFRLAPVG